MITDADSEKEMEYRFQEALGKMGVQGKPTPEQKAQAASEAGNALADLQDEKHEVSDATQGPVGPDAAVDSNELTDLTPMPFGKWKGKIMQDVPAWYLHWIWNNGGQEEDKPISRYIRRNLEALKKELPDKIW